jgi:transaldolase
VKLYAAGAELSELGACLAQELCAGVVVQGDPFATAEGRAGVAGLAAPDRLIFVELGASDSGALARVAAELSALGTAARSFVVRVPLGAEGLETLRACKALGVVTNATGCATALDAHAAATAGAAWISPAVALGPAPVDAIRKMSALLKADDLTARLLAGPVHAFNALAGLAFAGAHAAFASPAVLRDLAARGRQAHATGAPKPAVGA